MKNLTRKLCALALAGGLMLPNSAEGGIRICGIVGTVEPESYIESKQETRLDNSDIISHLKSLGVKPTNPKDENLMDLRKRIFERTRNERYSGTEKQDKELFEEILSYDKPFTSNTYGGRNATEEQKALRIIAGEYITGCDILY